MEEEDDVGLLVALGQGNLWEGNDQGGNREVGEVDKRDVNSDAESEGENFSPVAG